jgi:hypothetical protein
MSLILAATAAAGVLTSRLLLSIGLGSVLVRYPLATVLAYVVFLGLVRLWIWYIQSSPTAAAAAAAFSAARIEKKLEKKRRKSRSSFGAGDVVDAVSDIEVPSFGSGGSSAGEAFRFGGGTSGGGGAQGSWASLAPQTEMNLAASQSSPVADIDASELTGGGGSWLPSFDFDFDVDGDAIWLVLILAVVIIILVAAGGYLIWAAPEILPEVAFQALLAPVVAKAAQRADSSNWAMSAFKATFFPFLIALIAVSGLAFVVHATCPGAVKFSQALNCEVTRSTPPPRDSSPTP